MTTANKPTCEAIFSDETLKGATLQDLIHLHYPAGECESISISMHSPGPVGGGEVLTRLIIHPIHIQDGVVSPMAFNDATTLDLSVFREANATDAEIQLAIDEIRAIGSSKVPPQNRLVEMVMHASADSVREATFTANTEVWKFRVYDTGTDEKPAHASVFTPTAARKGAAQRAARKALWELFTRSPVSADDYRPLNYCGNC